MRADTWVLLLMTITWAGLVALGLDPVTQDGRWRLHRIPLKYKTE